MSQHTMGIRASDRIRVIGALETFDEEQIRVESGTYGSIKEIDTDGDFRINFDCNKLTDNCVRIEDLDKFELARRDVRLAVAVTFEAPGRTCLAFTSSDRTYTITLWRHGATQEKKSMRRKFLTPFRLIFLCGILAALASQFATPYVLDGLEPDERNSSVLTMVPAAWIEPSSSSTRPLNTSTLTSTSCGAACPLPIPPQAILVKTEFNNEKCNACKTRERNVPLFLKHPHPWYISTSASVSIAWEGCYWWNARMLQDISELLGGHGYDLSTHGSSVARAKIVQQSDIIVAFCGFAGSEKMWSNNQRVMNISAVHDAGASKVVLGVDLPREAFFDKDTICKYSEAQFRLTGRRAITPCIPLPIRDSDASRISSELLAEESHWVLKKADAYGASGISIISQTSLRGLIINATSPRAVATRLTKQPFLWRTVHGTLVKVEMRVFGVVTSFSPLRIYRSPHGFFRTSSPKWNYSLATAMRHPHAVLATNDAPLLCVSDDGGQSDPKHCGGRSSDFYPNVSSANEDGFSTTGSFLKLDRIIQSAGLNPMDVWDNMDRALISYFTAIRNGAWSPERPRHMGMSWTFDADVALKADGGVEIYEVHGHGWDAPKATGQQSGVVESELFMAAFSSLILLTAPYLVQTMRWQTLVANMSTVETSVSPIPDEALSASIEAYLKEKQLQQDLALVQVWPSHLFDNDAIFLQSALDSIDREFLSFLRRHGVLAAHPVNTSTPLGPYWREMLEKLYLDVRCMPLKLATSHLPMSQMQDAMDMRHVRT